MALVSGSENGLVPAKVFRHGLSDAVVVAGIEVKKLNQETGNDRYWVSKLVGISSKC